MSSLFQQAASWALPNCAPTPAATRALAKAGSAMTTISSQSRKKPSTKTKIIAAASDSAPLEPSAAAAAEIIAWPPSRRKTSEKTLAPTKMKKIMALTSAVRRIAASSALHDILARAGRGDQACGLLRAVAVPPECGQGVQCERPGRGAHHSRCRRLDRCHGERRERRTASHPAEKACGSGEKVRREAAFVQDRAHEQQHRNGGVQDLVAVRQRAVHAVENRSHLLDADAPGQDAQAGEEKCHADEHDRPRQAGEERHCEAGQHQCRQKEAHLAASVMIARRAEAMLASIKRRKPPGTQARSAHCRVKPVSAQRSAC